MEMSEFFPMVKYHLGEIIKIQIVHVYSENYIWLKRKVREMNQLLLLNRVLRSLD